MRALTVRSCGPILQKAEFHCGAPALVTVEHNQAPEILLLQKGFGIPNGHYIISDFVPKSSKDGA